MGPVQVARGLSQQGVLQHLMQGPLGQQMQPGGGLASNLCAQTSHPAEGVLNSTFRSSALAQRPMTTPTGLQCDPAQSCCSSLQAVRMRIRVRRSNMILAFRVSGAEATRADCAEDPDEAIEECQEPEDDPPTLWVPSSLTGCARCNSQMCGICFRHVQESRTVISCRSKAVPDGLATDGSRTVDAASWRSATAQLRLYSRTIRLELYCSAQLWHGLPL